MASTPIQLTFVTPTSSQSTAVYLVISSGSATVYWGDGQQSTRSSSGQYTHTYSASGTYHATIVGSSVNAITGFGDGNGTTTSYYLSSVDDWGNSNINNLDWAFNTITGLTYIAPIPSTVTSLGGTFTSTVFNNSIDIGLNNWNVSNVTKFDFMFVYTNFNQNISNWRPTSGTSFYGMFASTSQFNQPIGSWQFPTSNAVTVNMYQMFWQNGTFDQNIGGWNISRVSNLNLAFSNTKWSAANFSATMVGWAAQSVYPGVTLNAGGAYYNQAGYAAIQTLRGSPNNWTINSVVPDPISLTFVIPASSGCTTYLYLGINSSVTVSWGTGQGQSTLSSSGYVTRTYTASGTFTVTVTGANSNAIYQFGNGGDTTYSPNYLKYLTSINSWGYYNITSFNGAFCGSPANITSMPTLPSTVTDLNYMCLYFTGTLSDITGWNTSNVTNMGGMFQTCPSFNQNIGNWDTSKVIDMQHIFWGDSSFNQNLANWNVTSLPQNSYQQYMFTSTNMSLANINATLIGWSRQAVNTGISIDGSSYVGGGGGALYYGGDASSNAAYATLTGTYGWTFSGFHMKPIQLTYNIPSNNTTTYVLVCSNNSDEIKIDWGDNTVTTFTSPGANGSSYSHVYATSGLKYVNLSGKNANSISQLGARNLPVYMIYLSALTSWGGYNITGMPGAFAHLTGPLTIATIPKTVTNIDLAFGGYIDSAESPLDISSWDVSGVTSMYGTFAGSSFNPNISSWNTKNVTTMYQCFYLDSSFNQNLGSWNISKVTNMTSAFGATNMSVANLNSTLYGWSLQSVTSNVSVEFSIYGGRPAYYGAPLGTQGYKTLTSSPNNWTITSAQIEPMNLTFTTTASSQSTAIYLGVSGSVTVTWGDGNTTTRTTTGSFTNTYGTAGTYTVTVSGNNPYAITQFGGSQPANYLKYLTAVNSWGGYYTTSLSNAFYGCTLNLTSIAPIPATVTVLDGMFYYFVGTIPDITGWNTANVTTMAYIFVYSSFNQNISVWNTANLTNAYSAFANAASFNQSLGNWNVSNLYNASYMFDYCGMSTSNLNDTLYKWSLQTVTPNASIGGLGLYFSAPLGTQGYLTLTSAPNYWNISAQLSPVQATFTIPTSGSSTALYLGVSGSVTVNWGDSSSNVVTTTGAVTHVYSASGSYQVTIIGTSPYSLFQFGDPSCNTTSTYLTAISSWGAFNLTSLAGAFNNLNGTISTIATIPSTVTNLNSIFYCSSPNNQTFLPDITGWYTYNVVNMGSMFYNVAKFNQNITGWSVANVVNMSNAFYGDASFNQNLGSWNISKVTNMTGMLSGTGLSVQNFNSTLTGWSQQSVQRNVALGANGLYLNTTGIRAANSLTSQFNWTITGYSILAIQLTYVITVPNTTVTHNLLINSGTTTIYWGDALNTIYSVANSGQVSFIYLYAGTYNVIIDGNVTGLGNTPGSGLNTFAGAQNLTQITNLGESPGLTYFNFVGSSNLTSVPAAIPSSVTNLYAVFSGCSSLNDANISGWNVSTVTNLDYAFNGAGSFNRSLNSWSTANVTSTQYTFQSTNSFNQPLYSWSTANVTNMQYMFNGAGSFNQDLSGWTVSNVTNMQYMFASSPFNYPLNSWNVSKVINLQGMFTGNGYFNQPLNNWSTANVTSIAAIFAGATAFNQPINSWNTSSVTTMDSAFNNARAFNQSLNSWSTGNVTNMTNMFDGATAFNGIIGSWNVAKVTNMNYLFRNMSFNQDITGWNTIALTTAAAIFQGNNAFNQNVGIWNTTNLTNITYAFYNATAFNQNVNSWITANINSLNYTFYGAASFNQNLASANVINVTGMNPGFSGTAMSIDNLSSTLIGWAAQSVRSNVYMDAAGLYYSAAGYAAAQTLRTTKSWTINGVLPQPMQLTFSIPSGGATTKLYLGVSGTVTVNWGDSNSNTIAVSTGLTHNYSAGTWTVNVSASSPTAVYQLGDPSCVYSAVYLSTVPTYGAFALTSLAGAYNYINGTLTSVPALPSTVTNINNIFSYASNLSLDISQWDVSAVQNMSYAFRCSNGQSGCYNPNISGWNVKNATNMQGMFLYNSAFNQNISGWNVGNATSMSNTFAGATSFNANVGGWQTSKVITMDGMFNGAVSFNQNISNWTIGNVTTMASMLDNTAISTATFNSLLSNFSTQTPINNNVVLGAQGLVFNGAAAIQGFATLSSSKSWTINGTTSVSSLSQYSGYPFTFTYYKYSGLPVNGRTYTLSDGSNVISSFTASSVTNTSTYSFPATLFTGGNHTFTITDTSGSVVVFTATVNISFICFKEDTKILCLKYDREEYVPIQRLKKGDLVKTFRSGYVPIDMIGKTRIKNPGTKERVKDQLYVCKPSKYPEVFEDLYITGAHSILVDKLTKKQKDAAAKLFEHVCVTEGKYRLMACIDEKAVPYEKAGEYNIYHVALANDDPHSNYGVYANGLLVESCSKRFLLELSNMEIL